MQLAVAVSAAPIGLIENMALENPADMTGMRGMKGSNPSAEMPINAVAFVVAVAVDLSAFSAESAFSAFCFWKNADASRTHRQPRRKPTVTFRGPRQLPSEKRHPKY